MSILSNPRPGDEGVSVVGRLLEGVGDAAAGGSDTELVEGDNLVVLRDGVHDARVPVVEGAGEVDEENDGISSRGRARGRRTCRSRDEGLRGCVRV